MKLTLAERIAILGILPEKGDFTTIKILRELRENLSFTEKEHEEHKIVVTPNSDGSIGYRWSKESAEIEFLIDMGNKTVEIIKEQLLALDKAKGLLPSHLSLYERFVQEKEDKK